MQLGVYAIALTECISTDPFLKPIDDPTEIKLIEYQLLKNFQGKYKLSSSDVGDIKDYINIVTRLLVVTGLSFEMPVIIMVLAQVGIASPNWLASKRKIWFVVAFVLAAIVTPTMDPITQTAIAGPLIVLYEISIWLARLVYRKRDKLAATGS